MTTKVRFVERYETELRQRYPWAADTAKLERFMASVWETLTTERAPWNHDGEAVVAAWKAVGGKGKPTRKMLRSLA